MGELVTRHGEVIDIGKSDARADTRADARADARVHVRAADAWAHIGSDAWWMKATSREELNSAMIQVLEQIAGWEYTGWAIAARMYELYGAEGIKDMGRACKRAYSTLMAWVQGYKRFLGPEADSEISEELSPSHHLKVITAEIPNQWLERAVEDNLNPVELYQTFKHEEEYGGQSEVVDAPAICPSCGAEDVHWKSDPYVEDF